MFHPVQLSSVSTGFFSLVAMEGTYYSTTHSPPSPGGHRPAVSLILILLDMAYKLNHTVFSV